MTETAAGKDDKQRLKARDLNELIRYTMWAVFTVTDRDFAREEAAAELTDVLDQAKGKGIVTRGCYDLQGMRADADFMLWWVAPTSDELQEMYVNFRRTKLGYASEPVWSAMALHRPAEFNKSHVPAFLAGEEPKNYVCVYPFVRSYEWYLLDDGRAQRKMLAEHGMMAREYPDVRANTVQQLRAERLRVDARLRGRRAVPDRRPHASPARRGGPAAHAGRDPLLHRPPQASRGPGLLARLGGQPGAESGLPARRQAQTAVATVQAPPAPCRRRWAATPGGGPTRRARR